MSDNAMNGLKIADFSRVLAGPIATTILADLGAEVIKFERPGTGDDTRMWGPPYAENGISTYYLALNRNKRSVALDLGDEEERALAKRYALDADVVVENFRPGVMERYGLAYEDLRPENRGLVYCSVTGFGSAGGASLGGYDFLVQAMGGLMSITGEADGSPMKVGVPLVDMIAGLFATVGILAALRERERSGEGQKVEVNLLSSLLAAMANQSAAHLLAGITPHRMGNAHPHVVPYELLPTADGELTLAVGNDKQFRILCEVLGDRELADAPQFSTNSARIQNRENLRNRLIDLLSSRSASGWAQRLTAAGVPAGEVNTIPDAFELAETLGLKPVIDLDEGGDSSSPQVSNPITLSRTPARYRFAPPALDEFGDRFRSARS